MRNGFFKNFRHQITFSIVLSFVLLLGGEGALFKKHLVDGLEKEHIFELENNKKKVDFYLGFLSDQMKEVLDEISERASIDNKFDNKSLINFYSLSVKERERYIDIGFYDNKFKFESLSERNKSVFSTDRSIDKEKVLSAGNILKGRSFFDCQQYCRFYYVKPVSKYSFNRGFLQASVSIEYVINKIQRRIPDSDIFAMKKSDNSKNGISYKDGLYEMESVSSAIVFDLMKGYISSESDIKVVDVNGSQFLNLYLSFGRSGEVLIVFNHDVTYQFDGVSELFYYYLLLSFVVLVFVIYGFYFLFSKSMARIDFLSNAFKKIGRGEFFGAKEILLKGRRGGIYDELDRIHQETYNLTEKLENTNNELVNRVEQVSYMAEHDALTGLFNRRRFNQELDAIYARGDKFALVSLDMNHFKLVNDSMGHAVGDKLLQLFSDVLTKVIGDQGIVGRMGGDEFSAILFDAERGSIEQLFDKLVKEITAIEIDKNAELVVSSSIGVAVFPEDTTSLDELSAFSDAAMYENKRFKISSFNFYTGEETLLKEEKESQYWNRVINFSLLNRSVIPLFQPIVSVASNEIHAYEALARIRVNSKLISPDIYMSHMEKSQKIVQFDRLMYDLVLCKAKEGNAVFEKSVFTVNLSYYTLCSINIVDYIIERTHHYKVPAESIIFEITERVEISDIEKTRSVVLALKKQGFKFALDDFGAGFSSFFYLTKLPIDYLKIDKKIIVGLLDNPVDHHVVESIILLAKNMNIRVIAEGIDSPVLLGIISQYEIDLFQGYYFSRPVEFEGLKHTRLTNDAAVQQTLEVG